MYWTNMESWPYFYPNFVPLELLKGINDDGDIKCEKKFYGFWCNIYFSVMALCN